MKFKILWLYYDLLDLYGDKGNILTFKKVLTDNDINVVIDEKTIGDKFDLLEYDLLFLGGGSDKAQSLIYKDFINRKDDIIKFIEQGSFILAICGGYQLFGEYYLDGNGNKIEGLGIFPYYTKAGNNRCNGNIIIDSNIYDDCKIVGYENHSGETYNSDKPFGKVLVGHGNKYNGEYEGYMNDNFIGTYIHGPLIPKNPEVIKYIVEKVFYMKYNINMDIVIDLKFFKNAKEHIIKKES